MLGFHPGDPGSNPGESIKILFFNPYYLKKSKIIAAFGYLQMLVK